MLGLEQAIVMKPLLQHEFPKNEPFDKHQHFSQRPSKAFNVVHC
jgi:hypothetical protein